ncbi:ATP-grasp domain-containing protein [Streptomyces sp. NPDC058326]|uniref:ATP-grasp domain-containing protein n=1 Tax=Streptomyces sp. NPDC058326 TaxID=3346447 RepID=UPI0036EB184C
MNVLLVHVKKNLLPDRVRTAPEIGHLTVITEPGHAQRYGPEVDVRLIDDVQDPEALRLAVLRVLRDRRIDRIFAPFELGQAQTGYVRTYFGIPGTGAEVAHAFSSKYAMKQLMRRAGLPVADFRLAAGLDQVAEAAAELGWPVVAKPMIGGGSIDVCVLRGPEEFEAFAASAQAGPIRALRVPLVVEKFVEMTAEYHCDGVVKDGEVVFAASSRYLVPVLDHGAMFGSATLPAGDPVRERMEELHARAVAALGLVDGVTHMEFFGTADGLVAGEIACRPAGGGIPDALALHTGVDVWQSCLLLALGLEPKVDPVPEHGVTAHCYLPLTPGRIVAMTGAEELLALPSVVGVTMLREVGETVPERLNSAAASGLVFLRADSAEEAEAAVARVYETFRIEIEAAQR